jgi:dTMP kinase
MSGKLIVIEGGDGTGKATQTKLLIEYFEKQRISYKTLSFPRYETFYGNLVKRFLSGEFGSIDGVSPYLVALPYAFDRLSARDEIINWLTNGNIVLLDRYVGSSMAHQAAKVSSEQQLEVIDWIEQMEFRENKLPHPDLVIYLRVPWDFSRKLIKQEQKELQDDIAEKSAEHQKRTQEVYERLVHEKGWTVIDCVKEGKLRSKEDIHTELLHIVEQIIMKT